MIRCQIYLTLVTLLMILSASLLGWASWSSDRYMLEELPARQQLVKVLTLTDLSLWTEARYTRHPALTDLFSPFQDHPAAFEHFPAGGLMAPTGPRPETTIGIRRQVEI